MKCEKCGAENADEARYCSKCSATFTDDERRLATTGTGLDPNVAGLLCYSLLWISGIVFLVWEKKSPYVRFHAVQSIAIFAPLNVLMIVLSSLVPFVGTFVHVGVFLLWLFLMVKALKGEMFKLPVVGDIAEKHSEPPTV